MPLKLDMGKLISIVSNSHKQSEKVALEVQRILKNNHSKVALVRLSIGKAPDFTKSPYISSLYDMNVRYDHLITIEKKLKDNEFVIVLGYIADTAVRDIEKLNSPHDIQAYYSWLNNLEANTYSIIPADATYLVSDYPQDTLHELAKLEKNKYFLVQSKNSASKIVKHINNLKNTNNKLATHTLFDVICLISTGSNVEYKFIESEVKDLGLQELLSANKLISKKLKRKNSYIETITKPLGSPVNIINSSKVFTQHTKGMTNIFETLINKYQTYSEDNFQISSNPKNEIELSQFIAENYGMMNNDILKYTERMRIIENWTMQPNKIILQNYFSVEIKTVLSFYDLLLLNKLFNPIIIWQPISPVNGYVDCSAPDSIESIAQEVFDTATVLSATATKSPEQYLLLGHKVSVNIILKWKDIDTLYESSVINGSELFESLRTSIRNYFEEKFPIYTTTITNLK